MLQCLCLLLYVTLYHALQALCSTHHEGMKGEKEGKDTYRKSVEKLHLCLWCQEVFELFQCTQRQ